MSEPRPPRRSTRPEPAQSEAEEPLAPARPSRASGRAEPEPVRPEPVEGRDQTSPSVARAEPVEARAGSHASKTNPVHQAIATRRSVRRFGPRPVPANVLRRLVALAGAAPAPHSTHPWRFVHIATPEGRQRLSDAMLDSWRAALERDALAPAAVERRLARSRRQLSDAPALLLACLTLEGARPWPDPARRAAERDMFAQSLGAALQNLLLAAHAAGLAGYLKGAPLFCPDAVRRALDLPPGWDPAFLVLLGYPDAGVAPPTRQQPPIDDLLVTR
ncbi:MAG TPA: nitroreductase family protein [Dehalococcoidia bacterium]|nr:nitroreductase family protein [Dehalococcoidia bacterium]